MRTDHREERAFFVNVTLQTAPIADPRALRFLLLLRRRRLQRTPNLKRFDDAADVLCGFDVALCEVRLSADGTLSLRVAPEIVIETQFAKNVVLAASDRVRLSKHGFASVKISNRVMNTHFGAEVTYIVQRKRDASFSLTKFERSIRN